MLVLLIFSSVLGSEKESPVSRLVRKVSDKILGSPKDFQKFKDLPMNHDVSTIDQGEAINLEGDPTRELNEKRELKEIKDFEEAAGQLSKEIKTAGEKVKFYIQDAAKKQSKDKITISKSELIKLLEQQQKTNEELLEAAKTLAEKAGGYPLILDHLVRQSKMNRLDKQLSL